MLCVFIACVFSFCLFNGSIDRAVDLDLFVLKKFRFLPQLDLLALYNIRIVFGEFRSLLTMSNWNVYVLIGIENFLLNSYICFGLLEIFKNLKSLASVFVLFHSISLFCTLGI